MNIKTTLRNSIARLLFSAGLTSPRRRARGLFSIVTFHRVLPEIERAAYPFPGLVVTPRELDAFLGYFARHFDCGSLAAQHERYLKGDPRERPLLAITFDDANLDNHRHARPLLARHQVKASFFVPVQAVEQQEFLWYDRFGFAVHGLLSRGEGGRKQAMQILSAAGLSLRGAGTLLEKAVEGAKTLDLDTRRRLTDTLATNSPALTHAEFARPMTFDEIAELAADGHEIGSHSMTHCLMPECDDEALTYELSESKHALEGRLGLEITSFCYPNGDSDLRTAKAVAGSGYRRAVTTSWGANGRNADRYRLSRFDMDAERCRYSDGDVSPALVAFRMSGLYPGLGPARNSH